MTPSRLLLTALALFLLCGCASPERTADLRLGMTRDEAIHVMGRPGSVSAQGAQEFLNYFVPDPISSYATRAYCVRLVDGRVDAFGYAGQLDRLLPPLGGTGSKVVATSAVASTDGLKILDVQPATLVPGRTQEITVRLKYSLSSLAEADIDLSFNDRSATTYSTRGRQSVTLGSGEATIKAQVVPVDWGEMTDFKVTAHLVKQQRGMGTRPLATDQRPIPLKKGS